MTEMGALIERAMKPATAAAEHRQIYFDLDLAALTLAQRALAAREIFRRAAALIFRRLRTSFLPGDDEMFPAKASSRVCRRSICAFTAAMRLSLATERLRSSFVFIVGAF
ncbi:MAG: hypothetical protein ABSC01_04990 [Verrucomicrobiota bacterium]|jgi:hypothetical protein